MKKTTHKSIILLLMYALALNPLSAVLANDIGGLFSNLATADCKMEQSTHTSDMQMGNSVSSDAMSNTTDCKCQDDCQQGSCGLQCADCGHFFAGLVTFISEPGNNYTVHFKVSSDLQHQQPMLVHYRPPKALHS